MSERSEAMKKNENDIRRKPKEHFMDTKSETYGETKHASRNQVPATWNRTLQLLPPESDTVMAPPHTFHRQSPEKAPA